MPVIEDGMNFRIQYESTYKDRLETTQLITIREVTLIFNDILAYIASKRMTPEYGEIWAQLRYSLAKLSYLEVDELKSIYDVAEKLFDINKLSYEI